MYRVILKSGEVSLILLAIIEQIYTPAVPRDSTNDFKHRFIPFKEIFLFFHRFSLLNSIKSRKSNYGSFKTIHQSVHHHLQLPGLRIPADMLLPSQKMRPSFCV